jgi:hypothetical protein
MTNSHPGVRCALVWSRPTQIMVLGEDVPWQTKSFYQSTAVVSFLVLL